MLAAYEESNLTRVGLLVMGVWKRACHVICRERKGKGRLKKNTILYKNCYHFLLVTVYIFIFFLCLSIFYVIVFYIVKRQKVTCNSISFMKILKNKLLK